MNDTPKTTPPQRWFNDGASMVYPAKIRFIYWTINLLLFVLLNIFDLRVRTGTWPNFTGPYESGFLIEELLYPLNIFQYPSQILVKALIMTLLCSIPIMTAQLYNLLSALPYLAAVFFVGRNPVLCLCLFVSCSCVSFRPLRFKSKFVAATLVLLPELLYWWFFSGDNPETDRLRWAVLYAPWVMAFVFCIVLFGVIISLGHFFRYRPGIIMPVFGLILAVTILIFNQGIGMNERDYRAEVFRYSPFQVKEFQGVSIVPMLDKELAERKKLTPYLADDLIMNQILMEWRWAFIGGAEQKADALRSHARQKAYTLYSASIDAVEHIDAFIKEHPNDQRIAAALYFKALYYDMEVDMRALRDEKFLRMYFDVPSQGSMPSWKEILDRFGNSRVAVEARWRIARLLAEKKPQSVTEAFHFNEAITLLEEARSRCDELIQNMIQNPKDSFLRRGKLGTIFDDPEPAMNLEAMLSLQKRIYHLLSLLAKENRTGHVRHEERLAEFVSLNPHDLNYEARLKDLLLDSPQPDPLVDNIELAEIMLIQNPDDKIVRLTDLIRQYQNTDAAIEARLHLANALLEQRLQTKHEPDQRQLLISAREHLQNIIVLRPDSFFARQAKTLLKNNPIE